MKPKSTRREWGGMVAALGLGAVCRTNSLAIDPLPRAAGGAKLTLGIAAYSFRAALDLKKPTMTLFDFIDRASTWPVDAVELTSYYFAQTDEVYLDRLKAHAAAKKLSISGVPIRTNFCLPPGEKLAAEIAHTKTWIGHAARLGAKTVRVFAGTLAKNETLKDVQSRVVASLQECATEAEKQGIILAVENHHGITDTAEGLLALVKPITGRGLAVNVDTGNFRTAEPYAEIAKIVPYGAVVQLKTELFPNGKREPADLAKLVTILKDGNYSGTVVLEYEAAEDPKTEVPKVLAELRKLIG